MIIEIDLKKCSYDFLLSLLAYRADLPTKTKATVIAELAIRNQSNKAKVETPH